MVSQIREKEYSTPNIRMLTTVAGQTLNILGEIAVNFILNGELIQQEMLVVRGKTQQTILVYMGLLFDAQSCVDTSAGVLQIYQTPVPLLSLAPEPSMGRLHQRKGIPARSEKFVVRQMD